MSEADSEIIDFYPVDFGLDINGARFAWMGVNLLPFINPKRLIAAMKKVENLSQDEKRRNELGNDLFLQKYDEKSTIA